MEQVSEYFMGRTGVWRSVQHTCFHVFFLALGAETLKMSWSIGTFVFVATFVCRLGAREGFEIQGETGSCSLHSPGLL